MTESEHQIWYAALKAKDARFDGRFFVGVSSTGIYCRPVCRAKLPREENCSFYATAAEAEQAGFRPCLLCRPELAPGLSITDARSSLVRRATRLLEEHCQHGLNLDALAGKLGCTARHLRRVFALEYRVSPVQYLQTLRLLLAKSLLTDTNLPISEVAMTSGFGSLRRFNELFKTRYRMSPTALRKRARAGGEHEDITLNLGYRPPYRWSEMLDFLALRAIRGVEAVRDGSYLRSVRLVSLAGEERLGWIRVSNNEQKHALSLTVSANLLPVLTQVCARVKSLFDLYCEPDSISEVLEHLDSIRPGAFVRGLRVPGCFDAFEMCVRTVLGQQITVKAAGTLAARMAESLGTPLQGTPEGLTHAFPTPEAILALGDTITDRLGVLGIISARAKTIRKLAESFVAGSIDFGPSAQPQTEIAKLLALPGIGPWSAQYIAMRAMGWPDAFLPTDHGIKKALAGYNPQQIRELSEGWRPWRSYATLALWNSLAAPR
ncbi:MAG: DNA-3-methyladenine glycosylase 2 [Coriobacteriales bacterium]|jgi:AraC family transcriptional regulator of adaptative response / DNA-3-methyladenine glycosylase II|nr:DNA-3-methyladenine glycosylase 2 [Coriobacteriales bacterium]